MSSLNVFLLPHQRLGLHAQIGQSETRSSIFSLDAEKPPSQEQTRSDGGGSSHSGTEPFSFSARRASSWLQPLVTQSSSSNK